MRRVLGIAVTNFTSASEPDEAIGELYAIGDYGGSHGILYFNVILVQGKGAMVPAMGCDMRFKTLVVGWRGWLWNRRMSVEVRYYRTFEETITDTFRMFGAQGLLELFLIMPCNSPS